MHLSHLTSGLLLTILALVPLAAQAADAPAGTAPAGTMPEILLKLDDVVKITPHWQRTAEFIKAEGLKVNFGIINSPLEQENPEFIKWVKEWEASGVVQFWCHGYDVKALHDKDHKGEFDGTGYDAQLKALQRSQELAKLRFGHEYNAFGPHYSGTDADTYKALEQIPAIKVVWGYAPKPPATTSKLIIERRVELEQPIFHPNAASFQKSFESTGKKLPYISLQGHADMWDDKGWAEFQTVVHYLKAQGCRFITVDEWLAEHAKKP